VLPIHRGPVDGVHGASALRPQHAWCTARTRACHVVLTSTATRSTATRHARFAL
jgi:hypothetical protein